MKPGRTQEKQTNMDARAHRKVGKHMAQTHQHVHPHKSRHANVGTGAETQTHKDVYTLRACVESAKTVARAGEQQTHEGPGSDSL